MPADWIIDAGDTQPNYTDRLTYSDGTTPNLAGATLQLQLRSLTNASLATLTGTATIVNPNTGDISYTPSNTDTTTNAAGDYLAKWVVTSATLGTQSWPTDGYNWVQIQPNLGAATQQIVSPFALKRALNIDAGDHTRDQDLLDLLDAVTPIIEAEIGPVVPRVYHEWHDGGSNIITLTHDPSVGFGSNPYFKVIAASEYRGPIEYPLALVASPAFGSIYSVQAIEGYAGLTRRTAGGRTIAFMPGRDSVSVWYESGQQPIPTIAQRIATEFARTVYRWPRQTGSGSLSPADRMELGASMQAECSRIVRMYSRPMRRYPSIA